MGPTTTALCTSEGRAGGGWEGTPRPRGGGHSAEWLGGRIAADTFSEAEEEVDVGEDGNEEGGMDERYSARTLVPNRRFLTDTSSIIVILFFFFLLLLLLVLLLLFTSEAGQSSRSSSSSSSSSSSTEQSVPLPP